MRRSLVLGFTIAALILAPAAATTAEQSIHAAPATASSTGRLAPTGEPGEPLTISGLVVDAKGAPVTNASLYVYQTDREGYYGVKPASDSGNPRLKLFLRSDAKGAWSFDTVKPGSYPGSRNPAHIHFEVSATGHANRFFEIVFEGDPFITDQMRTNPAFSVRAIDRNRVTERIVLK